MFDFPPKGTQFVVDFPGEDQHAKTIAWDPLGHCGFGAPETLPVSEGKYHSEIIVSIIMSEMELYTHYNNL